MSVAHKESVSAMSVAHRSNGNLESTVSTVLSSQAEDPTTTIVPEAANANAAELYGAIAQQPSDGETEAQGEKWNKYIYPEFYGFAGKRYLDEILNAILPLGQVKTWEAADDCGPECYAGAGDLAKKRKRDLRTVERDLFIMEKRGLIDYQPVMRMLRARDGSGTYKLRPVMLLNFAGMLALAHEYHLWCLSDDYIPPERERLAAIVENEELCGKLLRFDIYRRKLCTAPRGRKPSYSPQDELYMMYNGHGMPKIQNSTLLSKTLSKILSSEETNTEERSVKRETDTNSKAEEGTGLYPPKTIRSSTPSSKPKAQVRIPIPSRTSTDPNSETAPKAVPQRNVPLPVPAKRVEVNKRGGMRLSTAEKVAAVTGILVEHQRDLRTSQTNAGSLEPPPLPEYLAYERAEISEAFNDESPASSHTDLARLYLRARVASGEQLTPEEFYDEFMVKPRRRVEKMLANGNINIKRTDNQQIANGMPLFMKWVRLSVAKAEKRARNRRDHKEDIAYLAQRYRQSQGVPSTQEEVSTAPSDQYEPEQPDALQQCDAEDLEAMLQASLHHPNPATRRSAARRLYARQQLPRLEVLGVPEPIEQLHHCFCPFHYAATPGAEPRCVSCDTDPGWPAEVAEIVEAVKAYRGD